jgi:hypothetical protein
MSRKFVSLTALGLLLMITGSAGAQLGKGKVLFEYWLNIGGGTAIADLTGNPNFPDNPTSSEWRDGFKSKVDWADNMGTRARAYLTPPQDGDYTFWVSGDDACQLWLSTDDTAANAVLIAEVTGWTGAEAWTGSPGSTDVAKMKSAPIALKAGASYYIEGLMKEGGGGDSITAGWTGPVIGDTITPIAGTYLTAFIRDPEPLLKASNPDPANGAVDVTSPLFQWTAGVNAVMHDVYFGTNPTPDAAEYKGPMPMTMYFSLDPLTPGTTYYWRIDEVDAAGAKTTGDVWSFTVMPLTAHAPSPVNGALLKGGAPPTKLSWTAGQSVLTHDVYLGTDKAAVTAGDASVAVATAQAETSFTLGALEALTTYYWRVDEHDASGAVQAGAVWSFRITDKATDTNTDVWAIGAGSAGAKFVKTYVADGLYDIGTYGDEQTYEFVVRSNPDEQEASMCLIGRRQFGDTTVGLKYEQWNNTGTYGATVFGVKDYDYGVANAPGEYTHLVFVSSKAAGTTDLYVNGELKGSVATAISLSGKVGIGYGAQGADASGVFDNFDGDIFGVAIYDKALTADEIAANADKYFNPITITDPDLLLYYDFEEGAGTIALDESGHSNHGLLHGQPTWATGLFGGCLSLNSATGDYVETAGGLNIQSNTISVTGWVKHDASPAAWSGILTHRGTSPGCLGLQHNGTELRYMWGADVYWSFSSGLNMPNGEWYFAALAISPTQGKLYLNGVDQTATNVAEHVVTNFDKVIDVGKDVGFATGRFMTGLIDEVRLYNRTLTDVDIQRFVLADVTGPGDAIQPVPNYAGCSPSAEQVPNAIDDNSAKKYLNFANSGGSAGQTVMPTGIQVTPSVGATLVTGITLTTANDDYGRDPIQFELSGSNDSIDGPWTLIAAGDVTDFAGATTWPRFTMNATAISFANTESYKHYQLLFTALRDPAAANSMQIGEVELLGVITEAPNMLPNGGFETGVIGPYGLYGNATGEVVTDCVGADVPEGPIEGQYCLHVVVPAAGANFWDAGMTDGSYTFKAGKKYKFSAWVKTKSGTLQFNMKPERGADPWEGYGDAIQTATDTWQEFSVTTPVFTEDVTPASPTFHIAFAAGEFWMDDIKLQELEP